MILKKAVAPGPHRLCQYLWGPGRTKHPGRAVYIGGTILGQTARSASSELAALVATRPDVTKPILHYALSLHPDDRAVTDEEAFQIGEDLAWTLDVKNWCILRHDDHPERQHWHWIASRVDEDGVLAREHLRDYTIGMRFARKWERQLDLVEVPTPFRPDRPHGRARIEQKATGIDREARNRNRPLGRDLVRKILDTIEAQELHGTALRQALLDAGLDCDVRFAHGRPKGVVWIHGGQRWKGSDLGHRYTAQAWFGRNALFEDAGGGHGCQTNVFHQFIDDDPRMDVGHRHIPIAPSSPKSPQSRGTFRLAGHMDCNGTGLEETLEGRGASAAGHQQLVQPVVPRPVRPGTAHLHRASSPLKQHPCRGNGAGADLPGYASNQCGRVPGRADDCGSMGSPGPARNCELPRGGGINRCRSGATVGMGGLEMPDLDDPRGKAKNSAEQHHPSGPEPSKFGSDEIYRRNHRR